jgi:hypothetical protein
MTEFVIVLVDGVNADNPACAWGARKAFWSRQYKLAAVIVSATAVNYAKGAPLGSRNINDSRAAHRLHTARMAGMFSRAGTNTPVFMGLDIADTAITTPIPHQAHVRHEGYDIYEDAYGLGAGAIAGGFDEALRYMARLPGRVHLVVGGPFSEVSHIVRYKRLRQKLGYLAAQAGFDLSKRAIYSKLAFNVDVDMMAALEVYLHYPQQMYFVPSDITRHPSVTFKSADELVRFGVQPEIGQLFIRHRARAEERHKKEQLRRQARGEYLKPYPALSIHDLQAVLALSQALGGEKGLYRFAPIDPDEAVNNLVAAAQMRTLDGYSPPITREVVRKIGYRGAGRTAQGRLPARYIVRDQNAALYKERVRALLAP